MSATRLLVLGAIRVMGPINGYRVRRELISWRIEETTNVKPGSIYSAIRTLAKDGLIEGDPDWVITGDGEQEFQVLLRDAWWQVTMPKEPLIPALSLLPFMDRDELVSALGARAAQLDAQIEALGFKRAAIKDGTTGADGQIPEHVREVLDFLLSRARGERDWTRQLQARLRDGAYLRDSQT